jgi:RimJ/RimL family protein N-acetyltransferase
MFIRSERLFLRPGWPEDWDELRSRRNDRAVARHAPLPSETVRAPASLALQDRCLPQLLVTLPGGDGARLIGCAGLMRGPHGGENDAQLAYWIAPEFWGQGYATEAGRAVLSLARTLGHRRITATSFPENAAAARVMAKLGFRATGETMLQPCPARDVLAESLVHCRELGEPSDCDGLAPAFGGNETRHAA